MARPKGKKTATPSRADPAPPLDQSPSPGVTPRVLHGPRRPAPVLSGVDRLRQVMGLSSEVTTDQLCDDAATELEELRSTRRPSM